ncbi:DUF2961 domain-containing protein [Rhizobium cauense]|uniref:DUF2961 domain-containing protein n=1 Tax=Rhizobium cauense TaxID=1166683 RepID=UPI001CB7A34C|nr:DUF2961 domain-containing protein [Rhizobium cauense]
MASSPPAVRTGRTCHALRWHIEDPAIFQKQIRVTIEHGHANRRSDDISPVAFLYQSEPHKACEQLPPVEERVPTFRRPHQNWAAAEMQAKGKTASDA